MARHLLFFNIFNKRHRDDAIAMRCRWPKNRPFRKNNFINSK